MYHNQLTEESTWTLQSPTYTTAGNFDESDELATIVSVQLVTKIEELNGFKEFTPLQVIETLLGSDTGLPKQSRTINVNFSSFNELLVVIFRFAV